MCTTEQISCTFCLSYTLLREYNSRGTVELEECAVNDERGRAMRVVVLEGGRELIAEVARTWGRIPAATGTQNLAQRAYPGRTTGR